jgi:hypothetical protein
MRELIFRISEVEVPEGIDITRVRQKDGERKFVEVHNNNLQEIIKEIVDTSTYGDPEKVLSWTTKNPKKNTSCSVGAVWH